MERMIQELLAELDRINGELFVDYDVLSDQEQRKRVWMLMHQKLQILETIVRILVERVEKQKSNQ
jgi:hypothetical protein